VLTGVSSYISSILPKFYCTYNKRIMRVILYDKVFRKYYFFFKLLYVLMPITYILHFVVETIIYDTIFKKLDMYHDRHIMLFLIFFIEMNVVIVSIRYTHYKIVQWYISHSIFKNHSLLKTFQVVIVFDLIIFKMFWRA